MSEIQTTMLQPIECDSLRRLGSPHDGGYVVSIDAIERASVLLSFGVATNWRFEREALRANPRLRVLAFDHSVGARRFAALALRAAVSAPLRLAALSPRGAMSSLAKLGTAIDYFRFFSGRHRHYKRRVWHTADRGSVTIADVLEEAGTDRPLSIFAKVDIEGSEYRILPDLLARAELFTGLVIEFHDTDICSDVFNRQLSELRKHFEVIHVHGNNYGDLNIDHSLPLTLEISLLNKQMMTGAPVPYRGDLPRAQLDAPNDPARPDYVIRF